MWNIKAYFGKGFSLSAFHCFLFHKNILYTFKVIGLLLTAHIIHRQIFVHFFSHLAEIFY